MTNRPILALSTSPNQQMLEMRKWSAKHPQRYRYAIQAGLTHSTHTPVFTQYHSEQ